MSVIILLISASLSLAGLFLLAFFWLIQSGQVDDISTPPVRILNDDHPTDSLTNTLSK